MATTTDQILHTFSLVDDDFGQGALKTDNVPVTQVQRDVITSRGEDSNFKIQVRMPVCVHGYLNGPGSTLATLMLFDYDLQCLLPGSSFRSVTTSLDFEGSSQTSNVDRSAKPNVLSYAPFVYQTSWNESTAEVRQKTAYDAKAALAMAFVNVGLSYSPEYETTRTQRYFDKGKAGRDYDENQQCFPKVWFHLQENASQKQGAAPHFRVALLLERRDNQPFRGRFKIKTTGDWRHDIDHLVQFAKRSTHDDPINFDPAVQKPDKRLNVDLDQLGSLADDNHLVKLTHVAGLSLA